MNNTYKMIGAAFVFLFMMCTTASSVSFFVQRQSDISANNILDNPFILKLGWPQIYNGGYDDSALNIVIDSQDSIIVTGYSANESYYKAYTVKYNSDGSELWNASYNSGTHDLGISLTVDSNDNILVFGYSGKIPISDGDCFILKYSSDGIEQWVHTFNFSECDYPGGIAVDSNDNIVITGGSGIWQMNVYYWIIKFDTNCLEQWNHTFHESAMDVGLGVAVDAKDNIITTGLSATPFTDNVFLIKYSEDGDIIWEKRRPGGEPWDIAIDSQGNIIITGTGYGGRRSSTMFTIKCDLEGTLLWTAEFDTGVYDGGRSVAIDSYNNIIIGGYSGFSQHEYYEHCTVLYDTDGNEICLKREGVEGYIYGVAVDSKDAVYTTGTILEGIYGYYTTKYTDLIPPVINFNTPRDHYLHLFSIPILPLPKRTIAIGKLNIILQSKDPSDIKYVELNIDNQFIITLNTSPYEWIWDNSSFGTHLIEVIAYDDSGCAAHLEINILKIF